MSCRLRLLITVSAVLAATLAAGVHLNRQTLLRQWYSYRVGSAPTFREARERLVWFERGPDAAQRIQELMGRWGTGNGRFDFYLAGYVRDPRSSEAMRKAFSLEIAWREELLPRWAHYWCWRSNLKPDDQIASVVDYCTLLAGADPPRAITWREVLDLQAVFQLSGEGRLAIRLSPENWRDRFEKWRQRRPAEPQHVVRPTAPFSDWEGSIPQ